MDFPLKFSQIMCLSTEIQSSKLPSDSHDIWRRFFCGAKHPFLRSVTVIENLRMNKFWIVIEHSITKKKINLRHLLSNKRVAKVVIDKLNLNIVTIGLQFSRLKFHRKIDTSYHTKVNYFCEKKIRWKGMILKYRVKPSRI